MKRKTKANRVVGIAPASERDWQAEEDVRTLQRAIEIKKDAPRYKRAQACARRQLEELAVVSSSADADKK